MSILQLQQRVLGPDTCVDYSSIIMQSYPPYAIQSEPFIGFKLKCRDTQAGKMYGQQERRVNQIDQFLNPQPNPMGYPVTPPLADSGVILRATHFQMPDGIWVITMPVPRRQLVDALGRLFKTLQMLEQRLGIVLTGEDYEINVSGICPVQEVEGTLSSLYFPPQYERILEPPSNTPFRYGHLIRINETYACFRTRWRPGLIPPDKVYEILMTISSLIAAIFK